MLPANFLIRPIAAVVFILAFSQTSSAFADTLPRRISIASWNLEWFFDNDLGDNRSDLSKKMSAPSYEDWNWKLDHVAKTIDQMNPTILALQEVENRHVVYLLTKRLKEEHGKYYKIAFVGGYDFYTEQDVAIIYQSGLVEYSRKEQSREMWDSNKYYNLQKHLFAKFEWGSGSNRESLIMLNVHFRATEKQTAIRVRQARLARNWLNDAIVAGENVVLLGDINTEDEHEKESDDGDMRILLGKETSEKSDDLIDLHGGLKPSERSTHFLKKQFDRILVSQSLVDDAPGRKDFVFSKITNFRQLVVRGKSTDSNHFDGYWKIDPRERDISDHFPIMAEFLVK